MKKFQIHSVETVSEVSQKSSVKIVTCKTKKGDQKVNQTFKKHSRTSPDPQFKEFALTKQN